MHGNKKLSGIGAKPEKGKYPCYIYVYERHVSVIIKHRLHTLVCCVSSA